MKKSFLLWPLALASLLMAGCSNDDILKTDEPTGDGETTTSYLSVKLVSSDPTGSRADGGYENGTSDENTVNKVRFYFFNNGGDAARVKRKGAEYVNYYDWTPDEDQKLTDPDKTNVGSILNTTLVIETPKGDKAPEMIAAVINPIEDEGTRSLKSLKNIQRDYTAKEGVSLTTKGKFVMFNSVYGNGENNKEICAVTILTGVNGNLQKTPAAAIAKPVILHVERNVAKVSVTMASDLFDSETNLLALQTKSQDNENEMVSLKVNGEQVYLKIEGWRLTAETDKGNLVKDISHYTTWNNTSSPIYGWWNSYGNKRSCWAVNAGDADNRYWSYNNINKSLSAPLYTNENAENYSDATSLNNTKVILKGKLCHADGKAFTIVRHMGYYFADTPGSKNADGSIDETTNLIKLKENILAQLRGHQNYYYKVSDTEYREIAPTDLKIVTVTQDQVEDGDNAKDCYVYSQLSTTGNNWYTRTGTEGNYTYSSASVNTINTDLATENIVNKALVWNSGMTYYYYEIIHHTNDDDTKTVGVVRNHVYKTTVTKIAGLGTPVYDPDLDIYPEKPKGNDHYIAAQVNILAWHIVTNDYELTW